MYNPLNTLLRRKSPQQAAPSSAAAALRTLKAGAPERMPAQVLPLQSIDASSIPVVKASTPVQVITPPTAPSSKRKAGVKTRAASAPKSALTSAPQVPAEPSAAKPTKSTQAKKTSEAVQLETFKRVARAQKLSVAWDKVNNQFSQPYTQQAYLIWLDGQEQANNLRQHQSDARLRAEIIAKDAEIDRLTIKARDTDAVAVNLAAAVRRIASELKKINPEHKLVATAYRYLEKIAL